MTAGVTGEAPIVRAQACRGQYKGNPVRARRALKPALLRPIDLFMDGFLDWIFAGLAALFFVAVIVAWWEHLGRVGDRASAALPGPQQRTATVDVDIDTLAATPQSAAGDVGERRLTLDGALVRMAERRNGAGGRRGWLDTAPMVGLGRRDATEPPGPAASSDSQLTAPSTLR